MAEYNICFEIASMCVLVLMLFMAKMKRQLTIFKNKLFQVGLFLVLFLNLLDMYSTLTLHHVLQPKGQWQLPLQYALVMGVFVLQQVVVQLFLEYVRVVFSSDRKRGVPYRIFGAVSLLYIALVLSSPVTKEVFYFDSEGVYQKGDLHFILYVIPLLYFLYGFLVLFHRRKKLPILDRRMFLCLGFVTIGVLLTQTVLVPGCRITYFWFTIVLAAVFFTLQSPDYYLDRNTGAFNNDGLMVMMSDQITRKIPFSVLLMSVCDFEGIKDGFSPQNKRKVYRKICFDLIHRSKKERKNMKMDIFRDDDKIYVMFHNAQEAEHYAMRIGSWVTDGVYVDENSPKVKLVATMLLFDFPGRIQSEDEFYSVIKYFMTDDYYKKYNVMQTINEEFFRKKKRYDDVRHLVEEAIRTEGIEMYYQPIYSTMRDDFHSAEALVRLRDTDSIGFVSPEEFIPIAEKEHLILQLEELILHKICNFIQKAQLWKYGVQYLEVNLSGNQCMQLDLAEQLKELIEAYRIPPNFINFEVTETSTIDNSDCLLRNMRELQGYGSSFALDDYGSGASNLKYLVDYPFEIVKLDKSIVWAHFGATNAKTRAVLPFSVRMLCEMNVRIVAEGVETEEQKNELIRLGVHYLQGYYFSKPISEMEYIRFLRVHNDIS